MPSGLVLTPEVGSPGPSICWANWRARRAGQGLTRSRCLAGDPGGRECALLLPFLF